VLRTYKFTTMAELNIILRQQHIVADRGSANSRMFRLGGLVYSLLDEKGYRTGVPIKASDIYGSPTLHALERKFEGNALRKKTTAQFTRSSVFFNLSSSATLPEFSQKLRTRNISLHFERGPLGDIRTVYFIDNRNKAVYTNDELAIPLVDLLRLQVPSLSKMKKKAHTASVNKKPRNTQDHTQHPFIYLGTSSTQGVIDILLRPEHGAAGSSGETPRKKKKRKRPRL